MCDEHKRSNMKLDNAQSTFPAAACLRVQEEALRQHRGAVEDNLTFSADLVCKAVYSSGERVLTANFRSALCAHA